MNQTSIFDFMYPKYKITKPIRLIEMFSGYGSQALALKYLGVEFEHWKICEWAIKSIQAYKDIHFENKWNYFKVNYDLYDFDFATELYNLGISSNYNKSMTLEQIQRLRTDKQKEILANIQITNNLVNIQQVKGKDLNIINTDKYTYIMTYSFPCQDLSLAGKGQGMKDTSTRSGMLWEVERILSECKELGTMPEVLLMENVPQVHGVNNVDDFNKWQLRLEELGYKNYFQDLIATDYGIPQTRNRCFMISILGDYSYTFPKSIPLKLKLKDLLEDEVDEKYYLSDKQIKCLSSEKVYENVYIRGEQFKKNISPELATTITASSSDRASDTFIKVKKVGNVNPSGNGMNGEVIDSDGMSSTLTTNKGEGIKILIKNATKKGYLEAEVGDGIDISSRMEHHRGTVQKEKSQTLTTSCEVGTIVSTKPKVLGGIGEKCNNDTQYHQQNRIYDDNVAISVTTAFNPYYKDNLRIRKLTPKECFRLMGVKDEDFEKVSKNQSDSSLYHLAGDSIVVNVLMAIFKEMM
jgi:DNA (cytosine-5)-methyltransferase 1